MNLFFLHLDPKQSANYYYNKHCIKIILEITQMLYCAHWMSPTPGSWVSRHIFDTELEPYRKTHFNHPTSKWIRQHINNYLYACNMALALCDEYTERYGKVHKCTERVHWLLSNVPVFDTELTISTSYLATINIPDGCTPVPLAMPDEYHTPDLIESYRMYYIYGKKQIADSVETWEHLKDEFDFLL